MFIFYDAILTIIMNFKCFLFFSFYTIFVTKNINIVSESTHKLPSVLTQTIKVIIIKIKSIFFFKSTSATYKGKI